MMNFTDIILIALFIEAIVNAIKPIWSKDGDKLSVSEFVSMGIGVLLAIACKINMLAYLAWNGTYPVWVEYVFYVLTGIAIGRGTNFLYDLWNKLKEWQDGHVAADAKLFEEVVEFDVDLNIENWGLGQLMEFCALNGIDATGCKTREEYIHAIERGGRTEPPTNGGAE